MKIASTILIILALFSCVHEQREIPESSSKPEITAVSATKVNSTSLVIMGTIQDAGAPQIGCNKDCCKDLFDHPDPKKKVVSLGLIDVVNKKKYLFDATPDFVSQINKLKNFCPFKTGELPDGIFLTHAHIGHYTGLMYLGKEAMNASKVPVFAMPKMKGFLRQNGPWSQLVTDTNIALKGINDKFKIALTNNLIVSPFIVPHRDEYSETVGYKIYGQNKKALFIPDIDKWERWETNIIEALAEVDYAFIDATFYDSSELNNRNMEDTPHPFVVESMALFKNLSPQEKKKIHFIHINHTNPILNNNSKQYKTVIENGFNVAQINDIFPL